PCVTPVDEVTGAIRLLVWKLLAKSVTVPLARIRMIRPPRPLPTGVTVTVAVAPVGSAGGLVIVMFSGPWTGTRIVTVGVVFGTAIGTERPAARSATKRLPALAGGSVIAVIELLTIVIPGTPTPAAFRNGSPTPEP